MNAEHLDRICQQAEAMSIDGVVEIALSGAGNP